MGKKIKNAAALYGLMLLLLFITISCASQSGYRSYGFPGLENGWTRYEAEDTNLAAIYNSSRHGDDPPGSESHNFYSGGKAAGGINKAGNIHEVPHDLDWDTTTEIAYVKFLVNVELAGRYLIKIRYNGDDNKSILVKANNAPHIIVRLPPQQGGKWDAVFARQIDLHLNEGENIIWVSGVIGDGWANIDCIDIRNTPLSPR
jgi:hypothetical protein